MLYHVVVARYEEDVTWTKSISNVIIYNKGKPLDSSYNQIGLANVGREGHTYYTHIYCNYDNLADYTIFLQGDPFPHSPNLMSNLHKYISNKELNIDFEFLSEEIFNCSLAGCSLHHNLPIMRTYEKLFNHVETTTTFKFGAGAQFIVSKKCILSKSEEFYYKIVKMLQYSAHPIEGYVIERLHKLIFTVPEKK